MSLFSNKSFSINAMEEFVALLRQSPDKITAIYASALQSKSVARSLFQALMVAGSTISWPMLTAILKYPLSYPFSEIDNLFCTCVSGLVAQDPSRAEHVFTSILSSRDSDRDDAAAKSSKQAHIELIKVILEAVPSTIGNLVTAIQLSIPTVHCTKMAISWLDFVLSLERAVNGIAHGVTEAVFKLLLLLDSHIETLVVGTNQLTLVPVKLQDLSHTEETKVGNYISPSFGSHTNLPTANSLENYGKGRETEKIDNESVEAYLPADANSFIPYVDTLDKMLVLYFEYLQILHRTDAQEYVKFFKNILLPTFSRIGMCLRNIRFTQFALFYSVSLECTLPRVFLEHLIRHSIFDKSASTSHYLELMNYLASFIARYQKLGRDSIISSINLLLHFATQLGSALDPVDLYSLDQSMGIRRVAGELCFDIPSKDLRYKRNTQLISSSIPGNVLRYLSVTRTLLYTLCFLAEELCPQDINIGELSAFLLSDICPLIYFYNIGVQFLHVVYHWAFLLPEELSRIHIILDYAQHFELPYNVLSCFYPFEPMCLPCSSAFVTPYYRDYWFQETDE